MVVDDTKEISSAKECAVALYRCPAPQENLLKVSFSPINVRLKGCMHEHFHIRLGFACAVFCPQSGYWNPCNSLPIGPCSQGVRERSSLKASTFVPSRLMLKELLGYLLSLDVSGRPVHLVIDTPTRSCSYERFFMVV